MGTKTHGMDNTPIYRCWVNMRQRCYNSNHPQYNDYGGRGIFVCEEWKDSFINFYNDMGDKPEGYSIERINNDDGYLPTNCEWVTRRKQQSNKRNTRRVSINEKEYTLRELSEEYELDYLLLKNRYYRGLRGDKLIKPVNINCQKSAYRHWNKNTN